MEEDSKIALFIGQLGLLVGGAILGAFTTAYLWNNIVSSILGITTITLMQALALDFFWGYFSSQSILGDVRRLLETDKSQMQILLRSIGRTAIVLVVGYIIIQFI